MGGWFFSRFATSSYCFLYYSSTTRYYLVGPLIIITRSQSQSQGGCVRLWCFTYYHFWFWGWIAMHRLLAKVMLPLLWFGG